jgi:hypothetical protein
VLTPDGEAVAIVLAGWTAAFEKPPIHMIITPPPENIWDVQNISAFQTR